MAVILKLIKNYLSTGSFLLISIFVYLLSDTNEIAHALIVHLLPANGKFLAFITLLGLVFIYEIGLKHRNAAKCGHDEIKENIKGLKDVVEKGRLVSDVNAAFTEFKNSGDEYITGEYHIKEIHTLHDKQQELNVNSYTQNKIEHLISKIKHVSA